MAELDLMAIEKLIETGNGDRGLQKLESLKLMNDSEKRFQLHLRGKIHFFKGEYEQALQVYQLALRQYGPHVRLLSDLVGVYLLAGQLMEAKVELETLEKELELSREFIRKENLARVYLYLVKVHEEFCRYDQCFRYLELLKELNCEDPYWKNLALVSELRLQAFLGNLSYLPQLYREVSLLNHQRIRFQIEKEHALCLAETQLFGIAKIKLRVEHYLQEAQIPEDKILMLTEIIEWCLKENHKIPNLFESYLKLEPQDAFEKALQRIVRYQCAEEVWDITSYNGILKLADECSPAGKMRLLHLIANKVPEKELSEEIWRRWKLMSSSYPPACQKLIDKKWSKISFHSRIKMQVNSTRILKVDGKPFPLPKNPLLLWLLRKTAESQKWTSESIIQSYWQSDYDESHFFRLKTAILRLNRELQMALKGEKLFQLTKQHLELNPRIEVEFSNDL